MFSFFLQLQTDSEFDPAYSLGTEGVNRTELEADYSPSSGAEVKNVWRCTSVPSLVFMLSSLMKRANKFTT
jgi:hypothetical protein